MINNFMHDKIINLLQPAVKLHALKVNIKILPFVMYTLDIPEKTDYPVLLSIWESSVKHTHHFLKKDDIDFFKNFSAAGTFFTMKNGAIPEIIALLCTTIITRLFLELHMENGIWLSCAINFRPRNDLKTEMFIKFYSFFILFINIHPADF